MLYLERLDGLCYLLAGLAWIMASDQFWAESSQSLVSLFCRWYFSLYGGYEGLGQSAKRYYQRVSYGVCLLDECRENLSFFFVL